MGEGVEGVGSGSSVTGCSGLASKKADCSEVVSRLSGSGSGSRDGEVDVTTSGGAIMGGAGAERGGLGDGGTGCTTCLGSDLPHIRQRVAVGLTTESQYGQRRISGEVS